MSNGLNILLNEFSQLPQKQQLTILYENTEFIKQQLSTTSFHRKIQYAWLSALTTGFVSAFWWFINRI